MCRLCGRMVVRKTSQRRRRRLAGGNTWCCKACRCGHEIAPRRPRAQYHRWIAARLSQRCQAWRHCASTASGVLVLWGNEPFLLAVDGPPAHGSLPTYTVEKRVKRAGQVVVTAGVLETEGARRVPGGGQGKMKASGRQVVAP